MKYKKIVCVVIDSFGIGQATDVKEFDDAGADTFGHILEYRPDLNHLKHLLKMVFLMNWFRN